MSDRRIPTFHMGELWPASAPREDPVLYGRAELSPTGSFDARSLQAFTLTYHAGRYGLDDTGSIKTVHRYSNDWGVLQMDDPTAANYVTVRSSDGTPLELDYHPYGHVRVVAY